MPEPTLVNSEQLAAKQDTLVSGTNIKTINGASVLGSGDLTVGGAVDNAAVNAAIGTDPSTTRAALQVANDPTKFNPGSITSVAFSGDSISGTTIPTSGAYNNPIYGWYALAAGGLDIPVIRKSGGFAFAASGHKISDALATHIPAILALGTKPSHVVLSFGTNDSTPTTLINRSVENFIETYRDVIALARSGNVEPIVMSIPPASQYNSSAELTNATRCHGVAAMNEALYELCAELGVLYVDLRDLENPDTPGAAYRGNHLEGDLYGLHPTISWHYSAGVRLGKVLAEYAVADDVFDYTSINEQPSFETLPTVTAGTNQTFTRELITREGDIGGNLLRVAVEHNGTKTLGIGDAGITFTTATGVDVSAWDVTVHTQNEYGGVGGDNLTPAIAVSPVPGTNRKLIIIKPARPSTAFTSWVEDVIDAINNHPEASQLCIATATGTPGTETNVFNPSILSTIPNGQFEQAMTTDQAISATDEVRGVVEVWLPPGAGNPSISVYGRDAGGGSYSLMIGVTATAHKSPVATRLERHVIATPWTVAGTKKRFAVRVVFGGAEGYYFFGRARVQVRTP